MRVEVPLRPFRPDRVPLPKCDVPFPESDMEVDLEIGCGVGYHPIQRSLREPARKLVAIEHTKTRFSRLLKRVEGHPHIQNIVPVFDDAVSWVTHRVPAHSLGHVFLLYPNPYPKHAQRNKRWHQMPFMGFLLSRIRFGGTLTIATNERFYFEEAVSAMAQHWGWGDCQVEELSGADHRGGRTHFEKKYLSRGETCFNMVFQSSEMRRVGEDSAEHQKGRMNG